MTTIESKVRAHRLKELIPDGLFVLGMIGAAGLAAITMHYGVNKFELLPRLGAAIARIPVDQYKARNLEEKTAEFFARYDLNHDGIITSGEFSTQYDLNRDGTISKDEYKTVFGKWLYPSKP